MTTTDLPPPGELPEIGARGLRRSIVASTRASPNAPAAMPAIAIPARAKNGIQLAPSRAETRLDSRIS